MKPLWTFERIIESELIWVANAIFDIKPGVYGSHQLPAIVTSDQACHVSRHAHKLTLAFEDGHREFVTTDPANYKLIMEGEWWYRGIYSIHHHPEGTRVQLDIYNAANRFRWAAAGLALFERAVHQEAFETVVSSLTVLAIKKRPSDFLLNDPGNPAR